MKTHEQLATLTAALEAQGWKRLNGNTWGDPTGTGQRELRTAYTHHEATVRLSRVDGSAKALEYRGAEPLTWARKIFPKSFAKTLDTLVDTP